MRWDSGGVHQEQLLGGVGIFLGAGSTTQDTGRSDWASSVSAGGMLWRCLEVVQPREGSARAAFWELRL